MNTTAGTHEHEWSFPSLADGAILRSIGAIGVVALAIVGLAGINMETLAAIATIVTGGFFLFEGGSLTSVFRRAFSETASEEGLTAEFMAGMAGVVLGILGLFGIYPTVLLPAAVIAYGAALLITGFTAPRFSGSHFFVAAAALTLGILGVIGLSPIILMLVGLLSLGIAGLLGGAVMTARTT